MFTSGAQTRQQVLPPNLQSGWESPKVVADRLRRKGVQVIAVGCCSANAAELRDIAGGSQYTVMARSVQELNSKVNEVVNMARGSNYLCLFLLGSIILVKN